VKSIIELTLTSVIDTHRLASLVVNTAPAGSLIGLCGPLGVGKTEFVKGAADLLGISQDVTSPTFVIETVYDIVSKERPEIKTLNHWDLYRLSEAYRDGELREYVGDKSKIVFIEWPERVPWVEKLLTLQIDISFVDGCCNAASDSPFDNEIREVSISGLEQDAVLTALQTFHPVEAVV